MIINPTWEQIFSSETINKKKILLSFDNGELEFGNSDVISESMEIKESICSQSSLKFGSCESSMFKIRMFNNGEPDLTKKKFTVKMYLDNGEEPDYFDIGTYYVDSDTPTGDRMYHDIVCYDKLADIMGTDYFEWYTAFLTDHTQGYTIKELRDAFFTYVGITQITTTLVNDSQTMNRNTNITSLLGKDILNAICELNGVFGHIDRTGNFAYIAPDVSTVDKAYAYYKQGTVDYNKYQFQNITRVTVSSDTDTGEAGEERGNTYNIASSWLTTGLAQGALNTIATNVLDVIDGITYLPFKATTYADLCVEVGDCITIPANNTTIKSIVLERTIKGIQNLMDSFEAKGDRVLPATTTGARVTKLEQQVENIDSVINEAVNRIVTFQNSADINIPADTWVPLGSSTFAVNDTTSLLVHSVAKVELSDSGLVKFRYGISGRGYEAFVHEVYMHADVDTATLFYVLVPPVNTPTRLTVEINTGNATGTVHSDEFYCAYTGTHLISGGWDGIIDVEDEYDGLFTGGAEFGYTDDGVMFDLRVNEFIDITDNFSLDGIGGATFNYTDSGIDIETVKSVFNLVSEDKDYRIISEDGQYNIESEG